MPSQGPAPQDKKQLQGAVSKEQGMVAVSHSGVDQHAVMVKGDHTFACTQQHEVQMLP